jgi:hypothetical protein
MSSAVLEAARQGDAQAIAYLINQALEPKGVKVRAIRDAACLHVLLQSEQEPSPQLASLVKAGVVGLNAPSIHVLRVYGRQAGQSLPTWTEEWTLSSIPATSFSAPPPATSPKPVQPVPTISRFATPHSPLPTPHSPLPDSHSRRTRRTRFAVPIAFATGFLVGVNWNHLFANPFARLFAESASEPTRTNALPPTEQTIALTSDSLNSEGVAPGTEAAEIVVEPEEAVAEEVVTEESEIVVEPSVPVADSLTVNNPPEVNSPTPEATPAPETAPATNPIASPIAETTITLKSVGDIIPGTNYPSNRLPDQDGYWLFDGVKDFFGETDILFGNFESTLTDYPYTPKDTGQGQTFAFRTPPHYANLLKDVGFDVLSVANNHSFDFDDQGFDDTIAHIEKAGMQAVGRRGQIVYRTVNDVTVAFIGFSYFADHNSIHELDLARALVDEAKQQASIVVISVHAGAEGSDAVRTRNETELFFGENRGNMVEFSRAMIDQGADLVLGHGPHVPRAIELYQSRLIAYSLGNFMGYRTLSTDGVLGDSLILETQLAPDGRFVSGKIIPVRLDDRGVPFIDDSFRSVSLIRNLIESDFPVTPLLIGNNGEIIINEAE